ncbi:MAG: sodium:alanine symporter family protein [Monoglobales bacterium]
MSNFFEVINNIIWGPATVVLILSCGVYFTLKTNLFQVRHFKDSITKTIFSKGENKESSFKAVSAALAGTTGTGNIAGVATSIALGGPGAVFWMIVSAFFGMMTKYTEVLLAVKFRVKNCKGEFSGGPMYYMEKGLGIRGLGIFFAILLALSAFGIGNMVQSNSVSAALTDSFGIKSSVSGMFLTAICFFVIIGGAKSILSATEIIVPVMALFYMLGTVIFLIINFKYIPSAVENILGDAFSEPCFFGGISGFGVSKAVKFGIARGVFTNEAGLGSSPVAHASADVKSPAEQGLWGIFEVFFDTIVMCSLTALVILTANKGNQNFANLSGMELTNASFETVFGPAGSMFVSISMIFFAVATILGWGLYGEKAVLYIFNQSKTALFIYKIIYTCAIYIGSVMSLEIVWQISDSLNGLMAIPNIVTLFFLGKYVNEETKNLYK